MDRLLFLSHAIEDKPLVNAFHERARRFLLKSWRDEQLRAGELLWSSIGEGLKETFLAVVFLTETSVEAASKAGRGLYKELSLIRRWDEGPERPVDGGVVLIDCVGYSSAELQTIRSLRPWAETFRLDGTPVLTALQQAPRTLDDALDSLLHDLLRRRLNNGVTVFPRASVTRGRRFYSPWAGAGGNSTLRAEAGFSPWEGETKPRVPIRRMPGGDEIWLDIAHTAGSGDWWAAVLGLRTGEDGRWLPGDIRGFRNLVVAARLDQPCPARVGLGIRFEDDSTTGNGGSFHQSSSIATPTPILREYFGRYAMHLSSMRWDASAYQRSFALSRSA